LGNGAISVTDWVQAGRYAARLDPLTVAGGPTSNSAPIIGLGALYNPNGQEDPSEREVRVTSGTLVQNQTGNVAVTLRSLGDETALGFSIVFDPAALTYTSASLGSNAGSSTLNINTSQAASGILGVVMARNSNGTFPAGTNEILKLGFRANSSATGSVNVALSSVLVPREISDANANNLGATFSDGAITINPQPALTITGSNGNVILSWPQWAGDFKLQEAGSALDSAGSWTNVPATLTTNNNQINVTVPASAGSRFYRLRSP
jgi:hypothetical protein